MLQAALRARSQLASGCIAPRTSVCLSRPVHRVFLTNNGLRDGSPIKRHWAVSATAAGGDSGALKINVEGMMCDGCSSRIENVLKGVQGVKSVTVSLEGKVATVQLADGAAASAAASAAALVDTINSLGFEAKLGQ